MARVDTREFYEAALKKHGFTPMGLHWRSAGRQEARFAALAAFLPDDLSGLTIADAGCGFADLALYLERVGRRAGRYIGLDLLEAMCEEARRRSGGEIIRCDVLHDPLPEADYYLCSGAMNLLTPFETVLFIRRCFEASRRGFLFNLLEGEVLAAAPYNRMRPEAAMALGKKLGARKVEVRRGYLEGDFTVFMQKGVA